VHLLTRCFFFQAEDGIRDKLVTGVQTCALPISLPVISARPASRASSPLFADLLRLAAAPLAPCYSRGCGRARAVPAWSVPARHRDRKSVVEGKGLEVGMGRSSVTSSWTRRSGTR